MRPDLHLGGNTVFPYVHLGVLLGVVRVFQDQADLFKMLLCNRLADIELSRNLLARLVLIFGQKRIPGLSDP